MVGCLEINSRSCFLLSKRKACFRKGTLSPKWWMCIERNFFLNKVNKLHCGLSSFLTVAFLRVGGLTENDFILAAKLSALDLTEFVRKPKVLKEPNVPSAAV